MILPSLKYIRRFFSSLDSALFHLSRAILSKWQIACDREYANTLCKISVSKFQLGGYPK